MPEDELEKIDLIAFNYNNLSNVNYPIGHIVGPTQPLLGLN